MVTLSNYLLINSITIQGLVWGILTFCTILIVIIIMVSLAVREHTETRMIKNVMPLLYGGELKTARKEIKALKLENRKLYIEKETIFVDMKIISDILEKNKRK